MSINMQNILDIRGEKLYLDVITSRPLPHNFQGTPSTWGYTQLMRYGTTDLQGEWQTVTTMETQRAYELYDRAVGIYELAKALLSERQLSAHYKGSFEALQQRYTQLEVKASDSEAKFQATAAKVCLLEKQCLQHQAVAQAIEVATADIAELKQALQMAQANVVTVSSEKEQLKLKQEQLESEVEELTRRLALQQTDHCAEIKELCKAHESKVAIMFKKIEKMLQLMSPETEDDS